MRPPDDLATAVFASPARPPRRKNIGQAIHHFRCLLRDKEDTSHVFRIYEALPSPRFIPRARQFARSETGQRLLREEPSIPDILDDHEALRRLPKGSVGQVYLDFVEDEGLSAKTLAAGAGRDRGESYGDLLDWYSNRERDTHDLLHVLTGYGRDALGEQCLVLFNHGQAPSAANLLLGYGGALAIRRKVATRVPLWRALGEARRQGRNVPSVAEMPIRELLRSDLSVLRHAMRIRVPRWYHRCHEIWQDAGIDPHHILSGGAA